MPATSTPPPAPVRAAPIPGPGGGSDPGSDPGPGAEFSDIADAGVHQSAVSALAADGVLDGTGCGQGRLCPQEPILRWEMAVWLVRMLDGSDPAPSDVSRFADVDPGEWWSPYVQRLGELEITKGCATEPLRYCPQDPVTRAQAASFLTRALGLSVAAPAGFQDTVGNFHEHDIDSLYAAGITKGCTVQSLNFCPGRDTSRGEMASFLDRALNPAS